MKKVTILFLLSTLQIGLYAQSIHIPSLDSLTSWRNALNTQSLSIAIIDDHELKAIVSDGVLKDDVPAPHNAIYNTASLAKGITSYLTLKLIDEGKWELDSPLSNYWIDPDLKDDPRHKELTTRHVLTHTTGFLNWRYMDESGKLEFKSNPGEKFGYSGEGFEYLKKALENKFETNLEILAEAYIFDPANMNDSFMIWENVPDSGRIAHPHNSEGLRYELDRNIVPSAADDFYTTVEDFANFGIEVMDRQNLSSSLFSDLISPQIEARPGVNFTYGWVLFQDLPNGEYALFNAGSDAGTNCLMVLLPESGRGMVAFTNNDMGRPLVMRMISEVLGESGNEILSRF